MCVVFWQNFMTNAHLYLFVFKRSFSYPKKKKENKTNKTTSALNFELIKIELQSAYQQKYQKG